MKEVGVLERAARPLRGLSNGIAGVMDAFFGALRAPGRFLQDFLNGVWLGHSLHAVLVDVVVGGATAVLLLDLLDVLFDVGDTQVAATWILGLVLLSALGAAVTGLTDYKDTNPSSSERDITALHGLTNIAATVLLLGSFLLRLGEGFGAAPFWLMLVGYLVLSFGAYVGGHVVYKYGYMVNYNAFAHPKRAREFTPVIAAIDVPEETPTKVKFGSTNVVLVRRGDVVHALKNECSHVGGPLNEGELHGDTITCPWHASTFRLADGSVVHGPASSRQVSYRARVNEGMIELEGPHD